MTITYEHVLNRTWTKLNILNDERLEEYRNIKNTYNYHKDYI